MHDVNHAKNPKFDNVVIVYNQVFDLGRSIDTVKATRNFLKHDFCNAGINYATEEIELANRHKKLLRHKRLLKFIKYIHDNASTGDFKGMLKGLINHPVLSFTALSYYLKSRQSQIPDMDDTESTSEINNTESLIDDIAINYQKFLALHLHQDKIIYTQSYLANCPFSRIDLQPITLELDKEEITADVDLFIHSFGIGILSIYLVFDGTMTTDELIEKSKLTGLHFQGSKVNKEIVELCAASYGMDVNLIGAKSYFDAGIEWLAYSSQEDASLSHIFDLYRGAVQSVILETPHRNSLASNASCRTNEWFAYPAIFLRGIPSSSTDSTADKDHYKAAYTKILAGIGGNQAFQDKTARDIIGEDYSPTVDMNFFIGSGRTLVVYYDSYESSFKSKYNRELFGQDWAAGYFARLIPIEILLIHKWQLNVLHALTDNVASSIKSVNKLRKSLLEAILELSKNRVSFGDLHDLLQELSKRWGIESSLIYLREKMSIIGSIVDSEETKKRNTKEKLLTIGGMWAVLAFGFTQAREIVKILSLEKHSTLSANATTVVVWVIICLPIVLLILWSFWPRCTKKKVRVHRPLSSIEQPNFTWDHRIEIIEEEQKE